MPAKVKDTIETPATPEPVEVTPDTVYEAEPENLPSLPEAGGIAWVDLYGTKTDAAGQIHEVKINLTARGFTAIDALKDLLIAIKQTESELNLVPYRKNGQAPTAQPVQSQPAQPQPQPAPAPARSEPVYENVETSVGTIAAVTMTVTPRADGKTKLDFFAEGHKYPDISCVLTPEQLVEMLKNAAPWTVEHFKAAANYQVNYKINWRNSTRTNQYGKPYKNIVSVNS